MGELNRITFARRPRGGVADRRRTADASTADMRQLPPIAAVELVVLQGTSFCNLNCRYCDLSETSRRTKAVMSVELLERVFSELFASDRLASEVTVVWHSGEPLTLSPAYYDDAIERIHALRGKHARDDVQVKFDIQTNGALINEEWCRFFLRHRAYLGIGVSCDGPSHLHDLHRLNWNSRPSHAPVVRGMKLLQRHGIKYRVIAVVTGATLRQPEAFYEFFRQRRTELTSFHFNVLAERTASAPDPDLSYSESDRAAYHAFYRRLLELRRQSTEQDLEILNFSQAMSRILASKASSPHQAGTTPLKALNVDARGNVTTFYAGLSIDVLRDHYGDGIGLGLGNIFESSFEDMVRSPKLQRVMRDFAASARACAGCDYFDVCPGGFEITKQQAFGTFEASETAECVIHVKALVDALLDDIDDHLEVQPTSR